MTGFLEVSPGAVMLLRNGARASNIFWALGSYAELGGSSETVGTIVAMSYIWMGTNADLQGAALSLNAAVTLDTAYPMLQRVGVDNYFSFSSSGAPTQTQTQSAASSLQASQSRVCSRLPRPLVVHSVVHRFVI
jgi:hypothetical protein